jgi:hypothetical protein
MEKAALLTDGSRRVKQVRRNCEDPHMVARNLLKGLPKTCQLLYFRHVLLHPSDYTGKRPAEAKGYFDRHHPVGNLAKHVRGGNARQFVTFNTFQEIGTRGALVGVRREMKKESVGVEKNRFAEINIGKCHGPSCGSSSRSMIKRSKIAGSPGQRSNPAVWRARLTPVFRVMRTFSFSFRGNGSASLSTPFWYVASTVIVMTNSHDVVQRDTGRVDYTKIDWFAECHLNFI